MDSYYIKCVTKKSNGNIDTVGFSGRLQHDIHGSKKKRKVIMDMKSGNLVKTATKENGSWKEGDEVGTVDGDYIRTDGNSIRSDNLGELPSCDQF